MTYTNSDIEELGSKPIGSDNPTGISIHDHPDQDHPDFEHIQAEIKKITSLHGGIVEWGKVVDLSISILSKESKDIRVAGYLCLGLFNLPKETIYPLRGYKGLKSGLICYRKILENYWEGLFPDIKKMRVRISAVTFLTEQLGRAITNNKIKEDNLKDIEACQKEMQLLSLVIDEKFKEESPGLLDFRSAIEGQIKNISSEEKGDRKEVSSSISKISGEKTASLSESGKIDADRMLDEASKTMRQVSFYLRSKKNTDPLPYRLIRISAWLNINELPTNTNNKTMIQPMQRHIEDQTMQRYIEKQIEKGNWEAVLNLTEDNIFESPFWLDLNYYSMVALTKLGKYYKEAETAVCEELAHLVKRLPGIIDLQFSDETPFCSHKTKVWIENNLLVSSSTTSNIIQTISPSADKKAARLEEIKAEVATCISEGRLRDVLALFQQELEIISSRREKFLFKLGLAKISLEAGEPNLAVIIMESLDSEISHFSLDEWEPDLIHDLFYLLWFSLNRLSAASTKPSSDINQRIEDVYKKLCRLNPFSAFELKNRK